MSYKILKFCCFVLFVLGASCQHSNPVGNHENGSEPKGYNLYFGNWGGDEVYVHDTDSNAVVDTLKGFENNIWDLVVTKSGSKMYVATREGPVNFPGKVYSINLQTKQVKLIFTEVGDVYRAPNGTMFIISKEPHKLPRAIGIVDTLSDTISFLDTLDIRDTGFNYQGVVFDKNRPLFYAVNNTDNLFAYDYDKREVVRTYRNISVIRQMIISHDGRYLYVAGGGVFDLEEDKLVGVVGGNRLGSLALSPDGDHLYVTDPGSHGLLEPVPSGKVFIFDTSTNRYVGEIDVKAAVPPGHSWQTDRIVLMPDGKTAYVSSWIEQVFVIDLQSREVTKIIDMDKGFTIPMALGAKP